MLGDVHYVLRSRADGRYLTAQPDATDGQSYLLLFKEDYEAREYLNRFAPDLGDRLTVEAVPLPQLKPVLQRWGYRGVALVEEPLLPSFQFLELA